ncbi:MULTISPECIES: multicopper oxidase domain-containing protein [Tenacibaculum]|uniref:multicopper oxidase domain-containing protein n=1 Tax=Tenacibaculum TaxID=104267 RepID=UPI00187B1B90|nr:MULTISPECIES: multicopper oxidase domain-containing protein [Tenacibaculum]MCD8410991.1 multicopper oxidase domain-containing protein [Tenacibaculum finnmarkense genomovar ulcerans]MCD8425934.1 multicopper oxidase domain-containing protein [Tenacibaculum dicentrarchi]MCG8184418.1 multicopper oxidase domain-containing protein [Tenacibaculum piscium]MCG8205795.1 multicopper oxidase domain-containing protein [Tenacibaculum piscium]
MKTKIISIFLIGLTTIVFAQEKQVIEGNINNLPVREHTITLREAIVNKAGKDVMGMTVNGTIPGPTLEFTEGEYAVIYVKNEMSVETSVHWHGLLLPNFYDGVPYLNTPPIEPGHTQKYEFPIKQSGTYWYHSHTMLQEQSGVYGSIVIQPKEKVLEYDKELVLMLSDWTNEKPMNVLKNLKRGNEWYGIKKGTATPLNKVIARGAFGAQLNFWRQRMEGADIADVYYPAFLINGEESIEYPEFKPGEKVRLRIIDGGASTSFWMTFGGETPVLVSSDGLDVVPVKKNKTFIGIAEAYDFIVTIPEEGKIEFRITAQDGSGTASAFLGTGKVLKAQEIPKPDKIGMMMKMAKMDMKMGAHALKYRPNKDERFKMKDEYGMQMDKMKGMKMDREMKMDHSKLSGMDMNKPKDTVAMSKMNHSNMTGMDMKKENTMPAIKMEGMDLFAEYNYDYLKSPEKTNYDKNVPVKEVLLNLTGNMNRYIWSMNGVPLSEADNIKINNKEVTRITFNNLTMMHHPMHLHGHFFRVLNKNGDYSPLKHTVNVPPMQKVTLEFYGNNGDEAGDWFFHCHILYHMMGGMARVMSYDTPRDPRMDEFTASKIIAETDKWYSWGLADIASNNTAINLTTSNLRNQFNASFEYGWNKNLEGEFTYERYLHDYLRVFGGVNIENETRGSLDKLNTTAVVGLRYLTPYLFNLDVRVDNKLRPRIGLGRSIMIFPKLSVFGYYEYQIDLGFVDTLPTNKDFTSETVWSAGAEYMLSRNFSLMASYDNRFGGGGGLSVRF